MSVLRRAMDSYRHGSLKRNQDFLPYLDSDYRQVLEGYSDLVGEMDEVRLILEKNRYFPPALGAGGSERFIDEYHGGEEAWEEANWSLRNELPPGLPLEGRPFWLVHRTSEGRNYVSFGTRARVGDFTGNEVNIEFIEQ